MGLFCMGGRGEGEGRGGEGRRGRERSIGGRGQLLTLDIVEQAMKPNAFSLNQKWQLSVPLTSVGNFTELTFISVIKSGHINIGIKL